MKDFTRSFRALAPALAFAVALATACSLDAPVGPRSGSSASATKVGGELPGAKGFAANQGKGHVTPLNCTPKNPAYGTAIIGPSGGELIIGPHRLIVPPGALTSDVEISGTVPADKPFEINLEPHGLTFKKAAGLVLDASDCLSVPTIVYLIDGVTPSDPILATYSSWWHTVACPIWHFSGYSVAFFQGDPDDQSEVSDR